MSDVIDLWKTLTSELAALQTGIDVQRRYMPIADPSELVNLRVTVYLDTVTSELIARVVKKKQVAIGIAIQQRVAEQTSDTDVDGNPIYDGIDDLAHGDSIINRVQAIADYWDEPNGVLFDKQLDGFDFVSVVQDSLYVPMHLASLGVFTSILVVTYQIGS